MVLLTGSTGFVGRALLIQLESMGVEVRSLIRPSRRTPHLRRGVLHEAVLSSLLDLRGLRSACIGIDTVIHLASDERLGMQGYLTEREIEGTRNLAHAAAEAGVGRLVFISHLGANLTSAYPVLRTKALEEELIRDSGVPFTIIRTSLLYGPDDHFTTSIAKMISRIPFIFPLPGGGTTLIQPLSIKDFVTALSWTIEDPGTVGQIYEIGGPEFLTFKQVVDLVLEAVNSHRLVVDIHPPYLRMGAWLMERLNKEPPITAYWLDYFAVNRTAELGALPRIFGIQPSRMESSLGYLQKRSWYRRLISRETG